MDMQLPYSRYLDRFDAYYEASKQFTIAQASLTSKDNAATEIDRVLTECLMKVSF